MKILLKKAAIELGVPKGKIKDMIKNKEISFELLNGAYYVDVDEVRKFLNTKPSNFMTLDKVMSFILKETLEDFKYTNVNQRHQNIRVMKKVLKNGYITDLKELKYLIGYFSNILLNAYKAYPNEFVKWFNIQTASDFYLLRNHYFNTNRNLSAYLEHFVMFDKLTNGKIKIIDETTVKLQIIKNYHFKQSA